jgi:NitT/TauT family transport system substrate-binding protein
MPAAGLAAVATALALTGVAACGSGGSTTKASNGLPTVTMMVGGIDKQIYLPYQLAQDLGFYRKYGVSMQLSTESSGGVGAEQAMASGQVEMAGAWYVHTIDFQQAGKEPTTSASTSPPAITSAPDSSAGWRSAPARPRSPPWSITKWRAP